MASSDKCKKNLDIYAFWVTLREELHRESRLASKIQSSIMKVPESSSVLEVEPRGTIQTSSMSNINLMLLDYLQFSFHRIATAPPIG
jgi:hypothetical protein